MTDSGPLLVPIRLDAFAVVRAPGGTIRRPRMKYEAAAKFATPEPAPFAGVDDAFNAEPANRGVYLMWTLPAALRHGVQSDRTSGAVDFPAVPNRWLVVRSATPPSGKPTTTAWIVESDYLDRQATSPYADPTAATLTPTRIGRKLPLITDRPWVEHNTARTFLRAVGPGDPAFAAFQPSNEDVFSIHDDLVRQEIGSATLHYFVAGWYANSEHDDPLAAWKPDERGGYAGLLERLGWTASATDTRTAATSLYHGMLLDVRWDDEGPPPPSPLDGATPKLALGNTSTDALTAFLRAGGLDDSTAELLEAFALDELDVLQQPGGDAILRRRLHASWFGSGAGGVRWQIVDDRPTKLGAPPPEPPAAEALAAEQAWVTKLNEDQDQLDAKRRNLSSLQRELYEVWWKRGYANATPTRPGTAPREAEFRAQLDPNQPKSRANQVRQLIEEIAATQAELPAPTPDIAGIDPEKYGEAHALPDTRRLTAGLAPRFFEAHDPVLFVAGLGHDLDVDPAGSLACRYVDEVLTAVAARGHDPQTAADGAVPVLAATGLPPATTALLAEFELLQALHTLDPAGFASRVATAAETGDKASFTAASRTSDAVLGKLPGLSPQRWSQAWLPLYLEWQAKWHPLPYQPGRWPFDGHDFAYTGPAVAAAIDQVPGGRALLTPGLAVAFRSRLERYIAGDPSNAALHALDTAVQKISGWDFLSQTLDGLMTLLALRDPQATRAPDGSIASLVGDQHQAAPQSLRAQLPHHGLPQAGSSFEAMRAGQLVLTRVSIVDRFGQALDVPLGDTVIAAGLRAGKPAADGVCAELPPRLLQGARLRFTPVSPLDDTSELDLVADVNPLCGFLVPDHIDRALAAHDPAGRLLGELRIVATDEDDAEVVWTPAPLAAAATLHDLTKREPPLADVLGAVIAAGAGALQNFLTAIDETLWTIDPLAGDADDYLTALAGRALALVRARLAFELDGPPLRDPSWPFTFAPVDPPFLGYDFPVQLGSPADREDGLVGYFLDNAYRPFHAVRVPAPEDAVDDPGGFVTAASATDILLRFDGKSAAHVTLLVDPRGEIQAHTGLLPTTMLELPPAFLAPALGALSVAFPAGPLLAEQGAAPLMPAPAASGRVWSWIERNANGTRRATFPAVDDRARFSTRPPTVREGFVQVDPPGGDR